MGKPRLTGSRFLARAGMTLAGLVLLVCFVAVEDEWITTPLFGSVTLMRLVGSVLGAAVFLDGLLWLRGGRVGRAVLEAVWILWYLVIFLAALFDMRYYEWWFRAIFVGGCGGGFVSRCWGLRARIRRSNATDKEKPQ